MDLKPAGTKITFKSLIVKMMSFLYRVVFPIFYSIQQPLLFQNALRTPLILVEAMSRTWNVIRWKQNYFKHSKAWPQIDHSYYFESPIVVKYPDLVSY